MSLGKLRTYGRNLEVRDVLWYEEMVQCPARSLRCRSLEAKLWLVPVHLDTHSLGLCSHGLSRPGYGWKKWVPLLERPWGAGCGEATDIWFLWDHRQTHLGRSKAKDPRPLGLSNHCTNCWCPKWGYMAHLEPHLHLVFLWVKPGTRDTWSSYVE
jgi:hypothetical protein